VALVGDAVHPMTPDLAQGACQAIVDATTLAGYLAASRDTRAALQAYQKRRRRNAATTTLISRAIGAVGQWRGPLTCAARDTLMRATPLPLQLRQLDLVLDAGRPARRRAEQPDLRHPRPTGTDPLVNPPGGAHAQVARDSDHVP
jgi:2-polyprenyl-6-methoxyphenol hydroxylase-like FAD-dependent oxidoreductase